MEDLSDVVLGADPTLANDMKEIRDKEYVDKIKGKKSKKGKNEVLAVEPQKLTAGQWRLLNAYWNHSMFVAFRYIALFLSLVAAALTCVSVATNDWAEYSGI